MLPDPLEETRAFWNASPCNGQDDLAKRLPFRYQKEPWLRGVLREIAKNHAQIHEVGCGQGTDGIFFMQHFVT